MADLAQPLATASPRPRASRIGVGRVLRLILATPLAWAGMAVLGFVWFGGTPAELEVEPALVEVTAFAIAGFSAVTTLWAGLEWLGLSRRLSRTSSELAGMLGIVAVLATLPVLTIAALLVQKAPVIARIAQASQRLTFVMERPAGSSDLRIHGFIGSGFAAKFRVLAAAPGLKRVEIDSQGGLIDDAWTVSRLIQARGLEVVVRRHCASACIILLMGAERRLADYDAVIAVHAAGAMSDPDDPMVSISVHDQEVRSDRYMVARGMPQALLDEAQRVGNGKVVALPAADAQEQGVLTGLLDGERPVTVEEARRRTGPIRKTVMSARD